MSTAVEPKRSRIRFPLRHQISGLLIVFTAAVALLSMRSTRDFLSQDKIATVRELQTLQVAQSTTEIRQNLILARNRFRENLSRLQNVAAGQVDLDTNLWKLVSVQDKKWISPNFPQALFPPDITSLGGENFTESFEVRRSPSSPDDLVLIEALYLQEGGLSRKVLAKALVKKELVLGGDDTFRQGLSQGLVLDVSGLRERKNPNDWPSFVWGGTAESQALFSLIRDLSTKELRESYWKNSLPTSREIPSADGENTYLFAWSSVTLPDTKLQLNLFQFVDRESILKGFRSFLFKQAFMAFVLLGFGVMVAQWLSRRLSRPIESLVAAAKTLETGNFSVRVTQDRRDEIGDLAQAFNHMAGSLYDREEALKAAQGALVQNEKLAALGTLSAGIAHEVKNPLAGILGNADMALQQLKKIEAAPESPLYRYLEIIQKETKRCRGIIDSLMRFSRQEKAEQGLMDLEVVGWEAIHLMEHSLNLGKVRVEKVFTDKLQMVKGNANQIEQVLLNMLQNAGHAMPEGGLITLSTEYFPDGATAPLGNFLAFASPDFKGPCCRLAIQDRGSGMTPEIQKKIFEPFFTTKPKGVGTGLGLSVTMGILGDHQARVTLSSAPGEGTTFFLDFMARGERNAEIIAQLEEIKHRKGGGATLESDFKGGPATPTLEAGAVPAKMPLPGTIKPPVPSHLIGKTRTETGPASPPQPSPRFQMRKPKIGGEDGH